MQPMLVPPTAATPVDGARLYFGILGRSPSSYITTKPGHRYSRIFPQTAFSASSLSEPASLPIPKRMQQDYRRVSPTETTGYLLKVARFPSIPRKHFYRLNGAVLTRHHSEARNPVDLFITIHLLCVARRLTNILQKTQYKKKFIVLGASCRKHSHNGFILTLDQTNRVFYVCGGMDRGNWIEAIEEASKFHIERFYNVGEIIGAGGFAVVHEAHDLETGAKAAVKTIQKGTESESFLQLEITIVQQQKHPHVVRPLDVFETSDVYQIVMEYVDGGSLFDRMEAKGEFSEDEVRDIMRQTLKGMMYIHSRGIVHRDLKPENILVTTDGMVKIADFGLSRMYDGSGSKLMRTLIGTPQFIVPELVQNEEYGIEVDMWACGIIMFSLVTGMPPFSARDVLDNYRSDSILINYRRQGWTRFSSEALNLTRMLLCKHRSRHIDPVGALQHRWFTGPERADRHLRAPGVDSNGCGASEGSSLTVQCSHALLIKLRKWVHAIRFIRKNLRKAGKGLSFKTDGRVLPHYRKRRLRAPVRTRGESECDYVGQDLSNRGMGSHRERNRTFAGSFSSGSMASWVTSLRSSIGRRSSVVGDSRGQMGVSSVVHRPRFEPSNRVVMSYMTPACHENLGRGHIQQGDMQSLSINPNGTVGMKLQLQRWRAASNLTGPVPYGPLYASPSDMDRDGVIHPVHRMSQRSVTPRVGPHACRAVTSPSDVGLGSAPATSLAANADGDEHVSPSSESEPDP